MNRKQRRAAQKGGGTTASPMAAVLANAFRAHQAGHRSDAERLYRDVLSIEPRNSAALHLLGALMHQSGRSDEAVSLIQQAIAIDPGDADYRYNLGCILVSAGRTDEAIVHLEKATALKPSYAAAHFELSNALARAGRLADAEARLRRVLELQPGNAELFNNLGLIAMAQNRRDQALAAWQRALQLQPDLALAHFNIALHDLGAGRPSEAEASLRRALAAKPDYLEAREKLAISLLAQGKNDDAYAQASEALSKRETNDTRATFARCLVSASSFKPDEDFRERLRRAIEEAWIAPYELAPTCAAVIKAHPLLGRAITRVSEQWPKAATAQQHPIVADAEIAACAEPLFRAYLETTPNIDAEIELFLVALRANLLDRALKPATIPEPLLDACAALARQCFLNEFVFVETASESSRVDQLVAAVDTAIRADGPLAPINLAALAMYRPLYSLDGAEKLLQRRWSASVESLAKQQITEPQEEARLRLSLPKLTTTEHPSSGAAETQFDESPSPRWVHAISTLDPLSVGEVLRQRIPVDDCPVFESPRAPEILIAGCGTGLQAVQAARLYRDARILAIDPSLPDLGYAKRQADRLGLSNIEFVQADFMGIASLSRQFDVIEIGGLSQSVANPCVVWQDLLALLRPGGLMKVSHYDPGSRSELVAARAFANAGNYQADLEGIRLCRQAILRLPSDADARTALHAADFYSTSAFRNLIAQNDERGMSFAATQAFIDANKLEFIGFETSDEIRRSFAKRFPVPAARKDLAAWNQFEMENSDAHMPTHVFWVRKPLAQ